MRERLAGGGELGREQLERGHGALGGRDQVRPTLPVVRRQRLERRRGPERELRHVPEPLALGAQVVLVSRTEPVGVVGERPQLVQPRPRRRLVPRQLLVGLAGGGELAPGAPRPAEGLGGARVGVDHRELVARPREPALLELAAHREQRLDGGGDVLAGGASPPRVGARAAVGEDAAREHEPLLAVGPELGQHAEGLAVR